MVRYVATLPILKSIARTRDRRSWACSQMLQMLSTVNIYLQSAAGGTSMRHPSGFTRACLIEQRT